MNKICRIALAMVAVVAFFEASLPAQEAGEGAISLRIVTDQPEAALDILDKRARGESIAEADWQRHRDTEGYQRLKKRSESFGATEFDAEFESYLGQSPEVLERRDDLRKTVEDWSSLALDEVGLLALAYLPEGAMLAEAGGPDIGSQATSDSDERATWARNLARFDGDIARLEAFFLNVVAGNLSDEERRWLGFTFINTEEAPQGAFYTVGWQMAAMVEKGLGREIVIKSVCDPRELLVSYNQIAPASGSETGRAPALWSETLLARLYGR